MAHSKQVFSVVILVLSASACYQGQGGELVDEIEHMRGLQGNALQWNGLTWNGLQWNGLQWNGLQWNGIQWNGIQWNGIQWNGIQWNGIQWNSSRLEGSSIVVSRWADGKKVEYRDDDLIGMEINLKVDVVDGQGKLSKSDFVIRATDIYTDGVQPDVYYYDLEIGLKGSNKWDPLCVGGVPAIPIKNYWNESTGDRIDDDNVVTFACTNGVLAHCVEWGYRPWATSQQCIEYQTGKKTKKVCWAVSLANHHQACTRMARADYCGTGQSWTVPGTAIDIYDALDPQLETPETDWPVEAEWNPNGAYCLDDIRQQGWKQQGKYPQCASPLAKKKNDCGSLKDQRALLVSKFEPMP